ncbi:hypothetical protein N1851_033983 [Merluccius polli]|uniref:Gypsy retrotransposon integrase-like protein 1 n=1 Tax=Merluccius polli TaxID=89951 RepID=A0AA47M0H2_MERPO|nr:hypothetical protein N1851_033983 [Merluccius polli]
MVAAVRNGKVRICIDPSDLNKVIKREHHPMRTVEEVVSMIPGAKVFSVLDAKSGFLQIELDETSSFLTTFNTPIGRFRRGKDMELPDTLSRAQLSENTPEIDGLECISMLNFVSVSDQKYAELKERTKEELSCLQQVIQRGWPEHRREVPVQVQPYWDSRSQLALSDGLLFKGLRIVVPPTMREHMLKLIHQSHLGIVKSKQRAREALYWPGRTAQIEEVVRNCIVVRQHIAPRSYVVDSGHKEYRRNSQHLRASTPAANRPRHWIREEVWTEPPELTAENEQTVEKEQLSPTPAGQPRSPPREPLSEAQARPSELYITRRGRTVKPPDRLTL